MNKQEAPYRMDRTSFSVSTLTAPSDEKEYWLAKTATERLQALEFLRQIAYGYEIQLPPDFKEFLQLLNSHGVEYLLIGGYAINRQNLKVNKKASGRLKDLNDLENLP